MSSRLRDGCFHRGRGAVEAPDPRTRYAGRRTFVDCHPVVPGETSVSRAHDICDGIEGALRQGIDDALITIHVEPEDKAKHSGIVVLYVQGCGGAEVDR